MRRRISRGFTLIEIMIVILIIGILLAILLPNLVWSKYQAQWTACGQGERSIASALESYHADQGSYPTNLTTLTTTNPVYISLLPTCPSIPSTPYSYQPGNSNSGTNAVYDTYTIACPGIHYQVLPDIQKGYPQYNPGGGLLLKDSHG